MGNHSGPDLIKHAHTNETYMYKYTSFNRWNKWTRHLLHIKETLGNITPIIFIKIINFMKQTFQYCTNSKNVPNRSFQCTRQPGLNPINWASNTACAVEVIFYTEQYGPRPFLPVFDAPISGNGWAIGAPRRLEKPETWHPARGLNPRSSAQEADMLPLHHPGPVQTLQQ